jgi:DNA-binding transcriptional MerR regulator
MTAPSTMRLTIGELSRRTGLPVRTIRFYSDAGVVPPADRTDAGYRLYGLDALQQLRLVRTLRDLGIDLASIRRVLEAQTSVQDVATHHARALETQIRVLRLRRAVLTAVAARGSDPEEMQRMSELAHLSAEERRRIVAGFLDDVFEGLDMEPDFVARMRSVSPDLPDDPSQEQVDAWIELAELVQDERFKASIRRMSEQHARMRADGEPGVADRTSGPDWPAAAALVAEKGEGARAAGIDPQSAEGQQIVARIVPAFAATPADDPDDSQWRLALADRLALGTDARAERYWQLLATINGWPPVPTTVPAWEWVIAALRSRR